ncbi:hypothetical protein [Methanofollis fontis]|uniref:hypothetical protein n=1 Tax=Methanofollis fontis TaxID=2052832 RepID=UPI00102EF9E4|nr:hypothetical protein [Methanofollis fontis]
MRLPPPLIRNLAGMICGDENRFPEFPYRTGGALTDFFMDLGLDYRHQNESRNDWTEKVLLELNEDENIDPEGHGLPSTELVQVIEALLDPVYYQPSKYHSAQVTDHHAAVERVNQLLKKQNLEVSEDQSTGKVHLQKVCDSFISTSVSPLKTQKTITFCPEVFKIPDRPVEPNLVSVMMPFETSFDNVYKTIQSACKQANLNCARADNIWRHSTVIQDIFELIYCSSIIVADFSGKNPNVFYEAGIAHTLGKHVVPITQNKEDIPFDIKHHRYLQYLNDGDGLVELECKLTERLTYLNESHY